jgi:hypothetical protein
MMYSDKLMHDRGSIQVIALVLIETMRRSITA